MLPSSSRTVISTPWVRVRPSSVAEPNRPPATAPITPVTILPRPPPIALPPTPPTTAPATPPIGVLVPSIFTGRRDSMVPMRTVCTRRASSREYESPVRLEAQPPSSNDRVVKQATSKTDLRIASTPKDRYSLNRCGLLPVTACRAENCFHSALVQRACTEKLDER